MGYSEERSGCAEIFAVSTSSSSPLLQPEFFRPKQSESSFAGHFCFFSFWMNLAVGTQERPLAVSGQEQRQWHSQPWETSLLVPLEVLGSLSAAWALHSPLNSPPGQQMSRGCRRGHTWALALRDRPDSALPFSMTFPSPLFTPPLASCAAFCLEIWNYTADCS